VWWANSHPRDHHVRANLAFALRQSTNKPHTDCAVSWKQPQRLLLFQSHVFSPIQMVMHSQGMSHLSTPCCRQTRDAHTNPRQRFASTRSQKMITEYSFTTLLRMTRENKGYSATLRRASKRRWEGGALHAHINTIF